MKIKQVLSFALLAVLFAACSSTDYKKTKSGAPYKIFGSSKGEKIDTGDIVKFHITQKIKDSVFSTTYGQFPRYEKVEQVPAGYDVRSVVMDVLLNARKGDSIYITLSMDTFIKRDPTILQNTPFKKGDQLITTIRVLDVFKTPEAAQKDVEKESRAAFEKDPKVQAQKTKDQQQIEEYLKANNIQAQKTEWGTYIQILNPGQGAKVEPGKFAMVRYSGMDLSGKVFDSNNKPGAALLPVQVGAGGVIMGFEDAVRQLAKGGKAKAFIPSVLGYGEMGSPPAIQPNQNLIFEIEVVDITNMPPQSQMPPAGRPDSARQ